MNDWFEKIATADEILTDAVWEKVAAEAGTTPEEAIANVAQAVAENPEIAPAVEQAVEDEKTAVWQDFSLMLAKLSSFEEVTEKTSAFDYLIQAMYL